MISSSSGLNPSSDTRPEFCEAELAKNAVGVLVGVPEVAKNAEGVLVLDF